VASGYEPRRQDFNQERLFPRFPASAGRGASGNAGMMMFRWGLFTALTVTALSTSCSSSGIRPAVGVWEGGEPFSSVEAGSPSDLMRATCIRLRGGARGRGGGRSEGRGGKGFLDEDDSDRDVKVVGKAQGWDAPGSPHGEEEEDGPSSAWDGGSSSYHIGDEGQEGSLQKWGDVSAALQDARRELTVDVGEDGLLPVELWECEALQVHLSTTAPGNAALS